MLTDFRLGVITKRGSAYRVRRIPLKQDTQDALAEDWSQQYDALMGREEEIRIEYGYALDPHQIFAVSDFVLPTWLTQPIEIEFSDVSKLPTDSASLKTIKGTVAFATHSEDGPLVLFQNFTRSKVIRPRTLVVLEKGTFTSPDSAALALDVKLNAIFVHQLSKLKLTDPRTVNTFLPLDDAIREATSGEIRSLLQHPKLKTHDVDRWANEKDPWFKRRFSMLRSSSVLDDYGVEALQAKGVVHGVGVVISENRIEFPNDVDTAKELLRLLVEEVFLGAVSGDLYETNSKRRLR